MWGILSCYLGKDGIWPIFITFFSLEGSGSREWEKGAFGWLQNWYPLVGSHLHLSWSIRKVLMPWIICISCPWTAFRLSILVWHFFKGNFVFISQRLCKLLVFYCYDAGESVRGSAYAFHKTVILYFITKKRPTLEGQIKSFLSLFNGIWMNRVKYALCIHW